MIYRWLVGAVILFLLSGCAIFNALRIPFDAGDPGQVTVGHMLLQREFQLENLPIRTLRIGVISDKKIGDARIQEEFTYASNSLEQQVGIRLEFTIVSGEDLLTTGKLPLFLEIADFLQRHPEFDIAVGVAMYTADEEIACKESKDCDIGTNFFERFILLRTVRPDVIIHELGHSFIGIGHSPTGVMMSPQLTQYFSVDDRQVVLRNKWKAFRPPETLREY